MRAALLPLLDLFGQPQQSVVTRFSPYFYTYFLPFFANRNRMLRKIREMETLAVRMDASPGNMVVDVGCGFGLEAIVLSFLVPQGATVVGIDHNEEKIRLAARLARDVGATNIEFRLQKGEDLHDDSWADIVLCRDVVSHVYSVNEFFDSINRMLRSGGMIYIIDDRNALSLLTVFRTRRLQKQADTGVPDPQRLRENDLPLNFFNLRRNLIAEHFKLESHILNRYARDTAGLCGQDIVSFVQRTEGGEKVRKPRFKYVNPVTGESYERLYNPFYLKRLLERKKFSVVVERPFFGFTSSDRGLKKMVASCIEMAHPLSLLVTPIYFVKGIKQG